MMAVEAFAPAKINLTLHVTGRRADGYHLLDSLVVFADVGDTLQLTSGSDMKIIVGGKFAAGVPTDKRNLVWQAAVEAGWTGRIDLEKNLPHGAGIGGGSADAAAVLRGTCKGDDLKLALRLGADVPVCLSSFPQRMRGIGEQVKMISQVPQLNLVLANPGVHLSTPDVFRRLAKHDNPSMTTCSGWQGAVQFTDWLADQRNDLQWPACALAPEIETALDTLSDAKLARMSGSGATCFGIFETMSDALAARREIAARHPDWWVVATQTSASGTV